MDIIDPQINFHYGPKSKLPNPEIVTFRSNPVFNLPSVTWTEQHHCTSTTFGLVELYFSSYKFMIKEKAATFSKELYFFPDLFMLLVKKAKV